MAEEMTSGFSKDTRKRVKKAAMQSAILEYGKLQPQAVDVEEAVLGALMIESKALSEVIDILKPEVFYKEQNQRIMQAIVRLFHKNEAVDILTVTDDLKKNGDLEFVGGAFYVAQLTNRVASAANIDFHARIVLQQYIKRELISISSEITHDSFEDTSDVFELLDNAEAKLFEIAEKNLRRSSKNISDLIIDAKTQIQKASTQKFSGVPSGFTDLDRITSGWQKSDLIILAARPAMGKTAFALALIRNVAVDHDKAVAFFSLEMGGVQLATRLISSEVQIKSDQLRKGQLDADEWGQLEKNIVKLSDSKLFIDDTPSLSIFELRAKARRLKAQHNIEMIVVDYLQLMTAGMEGKGNREQEISTISRQLKGLAKELDIPIIVLSQLSREVEKRPGSKRPQLSDLRESGAIEQDADLVLFIYRPEYYGLQQDDEGNPTEGIAEILVSKHRNGSTGRVRLQFTKEYGLFRDVEENYSAPGFGAPVEQQSFILPSKMNDMQDASTFDPGF